MKISNRYIDQNNPPLVIAEIGINHGGSLSVAKQMVFSAFQSGCEMIKHQTHIIEDEMTYEAKSIFPPNANMSIWEVMEQSCLSLDEEIQLKKYVESLGMIYISTPFSRKAADFLYEIGVPAFKIGSGECNHLPLIRHISKFGLPVIMSTGMQTIDSIEPSVNILRENNIDYALLECTNLYPSPPEIVSLKGISDLKNRYRDAVIGFSDHSIGPWMSLASVALGSCIIERHFTDSRYRVGPDISCSMDPAELKLLIDRSKEIHVSLNNNKSRSSSEEPVYSFARASVVADRDLFAGEIISESDIWARRPGNGEISVEYFYNIVGKKIKKNVLRNQQLKYSDFE